MQDKHVNLMLEPANMSTLSKIRSVRNVFKNHAEVLI